MQLDIYYSLPIHNSIAFELRMRWKMSTHTKKRRERERACKVVTLTLGLHFIKIVLFLSGHEQKGWTKMYVCTFYTTKKRRRGRGVQGGGNRGEEGWGICRETGYNIYLATYCRPTVQEILYCSIESRFVILSSPSFRMQHTEHTSSRYFRRFLTKYWKVEFNFQFIPVLFIFLWTMDYPFQPSGIK